MPNKNIAVRLLLVLVCLMVQTAFAQKPPLRLCGDEPCEVADQSEPAEELPDLYTGTIALDDKNQLTLTRCDLAESLYILRDAKNAEGKPLETLRQQLAKHEKFYVTVVAAYSGDNMKKNFLSISEISEIVSGSSCHLLD